jgi:hypothetical protein
MKVFVGLLLWTFCLNPLFAQNASLRGIITDESGGVVPAATVSLCQSSARAKTTRTNSEGVYSFTGLQPGDYTVQVLAPGLALPQPVRITLSAGSQTLNRELKVAARSEQVTVGDTANSTVTMDPSSNASAIVLRGEDLDALSDEIQRNRRAESFPMGPPAPFS